MRLAKLAVASVSPTVGAVASNVSRLVTVAREMAAADVTIGAFPGTSDRRLPARRPRAVARVSRRPAPRARALRRRDRRHADGVRPGVGRRRSARQLFNSAAVVHRGRVLGLVPKEKLPTYNVFYEGRTFSRGGPGPRPRRRRHPARRLPVPVRLRRRGGGGLRRRVVAGRADAPALLLGRRDRRQRLELAVPHGHRLDAARNAGDARGRQPGRA